MRNIDRIRFLDLIGRELQSRMTYSDINVYLKSFGINTQKPTSGTNSKWVYVKELLANEPDETILKISEELDINHAQIGPTQNSIIDSKYWKTFYFRLFISHVSLIKDKASLLQKALVDYGISAFVAHEDIEPTQEWQIEIEKALFSMDALVALITPEFSQSKWADQEIGVAIGRGVVIVPVRRGADPHGFIGKYQGFQSVGKSVADVASGIFNILGSNERTLPRLTQSLVDQVLISPNVDEADQRIRVLARIEKPTLRQLERLRDSLDENATLRGSAQFIATLNTILNKFHLDEIRVKQIAPPEFIDDDIPF